MSLPRHLRRAGLAEANAVAGAAPVKEKAIALCRNLKPVAANLVPTQGAADGKTEVLRGNLRRANQQHCGASRLTAPGDGQALPSGRDQPRCSQRLGQLRAGESRRPLARSGALAVVVRARDQMLQRSMFLRGACRPNLRRRCRHAAAVLMKIRCGTATVQPQNLAGSGQRSRMSHRRGAPMHPLAMGRVARIETGVAMRWLQCKAPRRNSQRLAGFRPIRRSAFGGDHQLNVSLHRQRGNQAQRARLRRDPQRIGQRQRFRMSSEAVAAREQQLGRGVRNAAWLRPMNTAILCPHCDGRQRPGRAIRARAKRRT